MASTVANDLGQSDFDAFAAVSGVVDRGGVGTLDLVVDSDQRTTAAPFSDARFFIMTKILRARKISFCARVLSV